MARKNIKPTAAYIGVSRDKRTVWLGQIFRVSLKWSHCFLFFAFGRDGEPVIHEANWRGVRRARWDDAHRADAWALLADDRMDAEAVGRLWSYCLGSENKFYDYPALVGLALRLAFEAWAKLTGRVTVLAKVALVCTSYVNECGRAILGEPYADREMPSPDEIAASLHLRPFKASLLDIGELHGY
jgi:hypothetical protein